MYFRLCYSGALLPFYYVLFLVDSFFPFFKPKHLSLLRVHLSTMAWCPPTININTVSILIHITTIVLVFVAARIAGRLLRLFTNLQLNRLGSAPVMFEVYTNPPRLFPTVHKKLSLSTPAITFLFLIILLLIPAELLFDHSIIQSERCCPERLNTKGLCAAIPSKPLRPGLIAILEILSVPWDYNDIGKVPIREGFRKQFDGTEYFGVSKQINTSLPIVVEGCKTGKYEILPTEKTIISIGMNHRLKIGQPLAAVRTIKFENKTYNVTLSTTYTSLFGFVVPLKKEGASGFNATIFESVDPATLKGLMTGIDKKKKWTDLQPISPIIRYTVSCKTTGLLHNDIPIALTRLRYTEIEVGKSKSFNFLYKNSSVIALEPMSSGSLTMAMLLLKMTEAKLCRGETFVWTKCGAIDIVYILPLMSILAVLSALWIATELYVWFSNAEMKAPMAVEEWYKYAIRAKGIRDTHVEMVYNLDGDENAVVKKKSK